MNIKCKSCGAMRWKEETKELCCGDGKWIVEQGVSDPTIRRLLTESTDDAIHFQRNTRFYNIAFQMTSFGAGNPSNSRRSATLAPTFTVQRQVYHRIGSD